MDLWQNYHPLQGKQLQILNHEGKIVAPKLDPKLKKEDLICLYQGMMFSRLADEKALKLQRQGRMGTFAPVKGQEAAQVGSCYALTKEDWVLPSFRELAALIARGLPLSAYYLNNMGNEAGNKTPEDNNYLPVSIPVGTHLLHAVGIGLAAKLKGDKIVSLVFFGDGATSEGDFHEAMNLAGVWQTATIFLCQNNQYAISTPRSKQSRSETIAQKAIAYGFPGIQVDGNDPLAMYVAVKEAAKRARQGKGPTLIEAYTYRLGDHTTADDASIYRSAKELKQWEKKDPLLRMRKYLENKRIWDQKAEAKLIASLTKQIEQAVQDAESKRARPEDIFDYLYAELTPELAEQKAELLAWLKQNNA